MSYPLRSRKHSAIKDGSSTSECMPSVPLRLGEERAEILQSQVQVTFSTVSFFRYILSCRIRCRTSKPSSDFSERDSLKKFGVTSCVSASHVRDLSRASCYSLMNFLRRTPCGHVFCAEGTKTLRSESIAKKQETRCSLCRATIYTEPAPCYPLQALIETVAKAEDIAIPDKIRKVWIHPNRKLKF